MVVTIMGPSIEPSLAPMLARLVRTLPENGDFVYEPKWDGFRCLAYRDGSDIDLRSRSQAPLARYFPELVDSLHSLDTDHFVVDAEIVVTMADQLDFAALLQRLHPAASRVERLARETPASLIAFDLIAEGGEDLRALPFTQRRSRLERLLRKAPVNLTLTAATSDRGTAERWLVEFDGNGIDGVVAKRSDLTYQPGKRAMLKVKRERTADCVVGGFRWHHEVPAVGSLLLGLYSEGGELRHVGLSASFSREKRFELLERVAPLVASLEGHPWEQGFNVTEGPVGRLPGAASRFAYGSKITWVPLEPELVCEVVYDHLQGERFRHPPKFRRWRPDRDALSCTYEQFESPASLDFAELLTR